MKVHFFRPLCEKRGWNFRKVFNLVRYSLSNKNHGIPIGNMLFVLGKDEFIRRIEVGFEYTKERVRLLKKEMDCNKTEE